MMHQAINTVKFKALCRRLGVPQYRAVGVLESLWIFAQYQAKDGELSKFSALEIAGWVEWDGGSDEDFINALVETRWLDRDGDSLSIHDWDDHKPNYLKGSDAARRNRDSAPDDFSKVDPKEVAKTVPRTTSKVDSKEGTPNLTKPNLTKPNQTKPNETKPNETKPNQTTAAARPLAAEDFERVRKAANRIRQQKPSLDRDWVWKSCCLSEMLIPGLAIDLADKLRDGSIRSPRKYIDGAIRKECEKQDVRQSDLAKSIPPTPPIPKVEVASV